MSTLGLDGAPEKEDNLFRRLFWPSDSPYELDTLGQQGLWVCVIVGSLSSAGMAMAGHPLLAVLNLLFYWIGGMGVRERSIAAAILVAVAFLLNLLAGLLAGMMPGVIALISAGLLLANVRGTIIASRWAKRGGADLFPERLDETLTDKFIDRLPARVWPRAEIPFYGIGSIYLALTVFGIAFLVARPYRVRRSAVHGHTVELKASPPLR